ncbi:hypothetical protein ACOMHN_061077 [Nucella lapillus]
MKKAFDLSPSFASLQSGINRPIPTKDKDPAQAYAELMASRRKQMLSRCASQNLDNQDPNPWSLNSKVPLISRDPHFLHCPVTKAASTFWNRFMLSLNSSLRPKPRPFSFRLGNKPLPKSQLADLGSTKNRHRFLEKSTKTVFVREPYNRMFSAYVDKILGPNPYFWKEWGSYWRRFSHEKIRRNKKGWRDCHQDLTFAQVMALAAVSFYKFEMHFMPVSVRCQPCDFRYDVIGKMETFAKDLEHVSRRMNLSLTDYFTSEEFRWDYVTDAVEDSVYSPFRWEEEIYKCISKYDMGLRIWRKLQIRGLVDRRIVFPFSREEFQPVTAPKLVSVAMAAYVDSKDREELKRQKKAAFVEAYRTVDLHDVHKLQEAFKEDFLMFGYDSAPEEVFDRQEPLDLPGAFDWAVPWGEK